MYKLVFVPDNSFKPNLMFAHKTGVLHYWSYAQTLDQAGKACQGQRIAYFKYF